MSYDPVRCGFPISSNLRCGAVRCGFQEGKNPTVRCGAVNRTEPPRSDRKNRTVKNPEKLPIYVRKRRKKKVQIRVCRIVFAVRLESQNVSHTGMYVYVLFPSCLPKKDWYTALPIKTLYIFVPDSPQSAERVAIDHTSAEK